MAAGSGFYLTVNINNAVALNGYQFNLAFDPAVVQMAGIDMLAGPSSGVIDGVIGGVTIPGFGWTYQPNPPGDVSGQIKFIARLDGIDNATGSGFLAKIYMKVLGAAGSHSTLSLNNVDLVNALSEETFPANPTPVTVNVSADPALITSVTTVAADNITASGAIMRGTLNSLGTAAAVDLLVGYSTVQGGPYTMLAGPVGVTSAQSFSVPASGLAAATKYYCIALAQYGSPAQIVTGAELNFTTTGTALTPTITTINPAAGLREPL